jgi:magnesium transporter
MIRTLYLSSAGEISSDIQLSEISKLMEDPSAVLWIDMMETDPSKCEPLLLETFGFHPLAVEDALKETHVPKIDDWDNYLYVVLNSVFFETDDELSSNEIDIFLGKNYLVTYHESFVPSIELLWERCQQDGRLMRRGSTRLMYRLMDQVVENALPLIEELGVSLARLEEDIFQSPSPSRLEQVLSLKRSVLQIWRVISPQREVLFKLARDDYPIIDPSLRIYFRDVYDHLVRLDDINQSIREQVDSTIDLYQSTVSNRMSEVMKTLTIITTLFMPLSFLAGFFGMNFFQASELLPAWTSSDALFFGSTAMILLLVGMYFWIRRRGWM